jgi:hypothetical protein
MPVRSMSLHLRSAPDAHRASGCEWRAAASVVDAAARTAATGGCPGEVTDAK